MNQQDILLFIFLPLFALILAYLAILTIIVTELKRNNPDVWERLGRPSFLNQSIQNSFILSKFMYSLQYRNVKNRKVQHLGDIALVINIVVIVLFVCFIVETGGKGLHFTFKLGL
jgi:hypothetical protein